jgi:acyl-CoA thioester hydrolase
MKLPVTRTSIQTRYSDTDAMGHISSGSYITFMEVGRLDFFDQLPDNKGWEQPSVIANITIDYIQECHYSEAIEVLSWCPHVGKKSLKIINEIYANGNLVARGSVVVVGFDVQTRQSAPLPEDWEPSDYSGK